MRGGARSVGAVSATTSPPRVQGNLVMAALLTGVAGFVDAHIFVHVTDVFVANQSGNVVLFGIFLGERKWPQVAAHLLAITMFATGVAIGTIIHDRRRAAGQPLRPDLILAAEAVMLAVLIGLRAVDSHARVLEVDALDYPVIFLGALAMGLQTVVIGKVGTVAVATTYESGAVARFGEEAALATRAGATEHRHRHAAVVRVMAVVVGSYALGATLAAAAGAGAAWLLIPLAAVVGCALFARRTLGSQPTEPAPG